MEIIHRADSVLFFPMASDSSISRQGAYSTSLADDLKKQKNDELLEAVNDGNVGLTSA